MRPQRIVLEQEAYVSLVGRYVDSFLRIEYSDAIDDDLSGGRCLQAGDHTQRCRLTASGRAQKGDERSVLDHHVQIIHSHKFISKFFSYIL